MTARSEQTKGLWATTAAFLTWAVVPVYWKAVGAIPAQEMIAWRVLWALPFLALLLHLGKSWRQVRAVLARPKLLGWLALSAALVGFNWFVFIQAMGDDRVMETSLGYYINPLVNVLLGFVFLGERMRRAQWIAIGLATTGVIWLVVAVGTLPITALELAFSFALYGLVRKLVPVDALPGLFLEVLILTPAALAWFGVQAVGRGVLHAPSHQLLLVPLAGLLTALPLSWFAYGARRLPLATVGILQFLAPTGQFLLATLAYGELFTSAHAVTFGFIWAGVALYLFDVRRSRRPREPTVLAGAPSA